MLLMVENGIRGGITKAGKRYAKSNNKYMKDLCNPDEKGIYLQYLDANNLYMDGQRFKTYQHMSLNGRRQETLHLKK